VPLTTNASAPLSPIYAAFGQFMHNPPGKKLSVTTSQHTSSGKNNTDKLAMQFANATWRRVGVDEGAVKTVLAQVHQTQQAPAFEATLQTLMQQDGRVFANAQAVLQHKWAGNMVSLAFNRAPLKETGDIYHTGVNHHTGSPWEYRLRGVWLSLANFMQMCRQYPVMSTVVIAATSYFGGKYPFLGGASGLGIVGLAAGGIAHHELKAKQQGPGMSAEKANHYQTSGENLSALLLTMSGIDGIVEGAWQGVKAMHAPVAASATPLVQQAIRLWNGIKMTMPGGHPMGPRFVLGLLDNVLMPFNAMAKKLNGQKATEDKNSSV
jgi:hypothetical protein